MNRLLPDLRLKFIRGGRRRLYAVTRGFAYLSLVPRVRTREVRAGLTTDMGSVPYLLQLIVPPDKVLEGFVAHDALYQTSDVTRRQADWVLLELASRRAIRQMSMWTLVQAVIVFFGVRIGGWVAWRRYRKRESTCPQPTPPPAAV